jgi:probable O-glycosylation ligase (exosortase A-associated)
MPPGNQNNNLLFLHRTGPKTKNIKHSFVTIFLFVFIVVSTARLSELFPYRIALIIGIIIIGAYLLRRSEKNHYRLSKFPELICIALIGLFVLLSVPFSIWPGNSFKFIIDNYLKTLIIFYIIIKTTTDLKKLKTISYAVGLSGILLTALLFFQGSVTESWRVYFASYDPNDTALILVVILPFLFSFYNTAPKYYVKVLWLFFIISISVGIFLTGSRGGLLGYFVIGTLMLFKFSKKGVIKNLIVLSIIIIVSAFFIPERYWERVQNFQGIKEDVTAQNRLNTWRRGLEFMVENPLFGIGVAGFTTAEGMSHMDIGGAWRNAHNSFIQIGAEIGIIGLISFILLFYLLDKRLRGLHLYLYQDRLDRKGFITHLVIGLRISLIGYIVCSFFLSQAFSPLLYVLTALILASSIVSENTEAPKLN